MQVKKEPLTPRQNKQKNDKVQVILRIRPFFSGQQEQQFISPQPNNSIAINKPGMTTYMKFNHVQNLVHEEIDNAQSQKEMASSVEDAVKCVFEGIDSTIFAYGQTGAGKTYTIIGNCPENHSDSEFYKQTICSVERGILPRALDIIFEEHRKKKDSRITISFYEIYNEKIFDLLSGGLTPLQIRESRTGQINIAGLTAIQVVSFKEAITFLAQGIKNRATSATSVNIKSSRSHSIFHLKYEKLVFNPETKEHEVLIANLRVVDLAGSEKFNISSDLPQAQKELKLLQLKSINGSLSKLGHCISALTIQSRTHIPVRDSKLTRILSESLIGAGKIRLIICVSPSSSSMNETSSTLQFADRVKKAIFERPTVNPNLDRKKVDFEQYAAVVEQLQLQRQKRQQLERLLADMKVKPNEMSLLVENQKLKQEVNLLKEQLKVYSNQERMISSRSKTPNGNGNIQSQRKSVSPYSATNIKPNHAKRPTFPQSTNKSKRCSNVNQNDQNASQKICSQIFKRFRKQISKVQHR